MRRVAFVPVLCLLLLEGCAPGSVTHPPVPPIRTEEIPAPPSSSVVVIWQPGHFDWNGSDYVWIPGEWVDRAGHGTAWQDGYWGGSAPNSVWVPAHWL